MGDNAKSDDSLKFILDEKVVAKNIFKGNVEDVIDLPEKRYSINKVAFGNINSYRCSGIWINNLVYLKRLEKVQIFVDAAHIRIISKDRKSAQRKMMRGLHSRLRK